MKKIFISLFISLIFCLINIFFCIYIRNEIIKQIYIPESGIDSIDNFLLSYKNSLIIEKEVFKSLFVGEIKIDDVLFKIKNSYENLIFLFKK